MPFSLTNSRRLGPRVPVVAAPLLFFILFFLPPAVWAAGNWFWSNPTPHGNNILDLAVYNSLVVQVTDSGQLYASDDLNLWLPRDTHTTNTLESLAVFGNRLLAVGANGTVIYSDDGVNFTATNLATPHSDWLVSVAASPNLAVAVGDEALIYTSKNGANWVVQPAPPGVGTRWLRGITYGNGLFVTVGEGGYLAISPDGTNWTQRTMANFSDDLNCVSWVNTPGGVFGFGTATYLAVSDQGRCLISTNGAAWSLLFNTATSGGTNLYTISGDLNSRLFGGSEALFLERLPLPRNPVYQTQIGTFTNTAPSWTYYSSLSTSNYYLVAGEAGLVLQGTYSGAYTWSPLDQSSRSWLWQVAWLPYPGLYVAVGDQANIMTSPNGVDWSLESVPNTNSVSATNTVFFGVGGSTNLLLAVGSGGTVALSTNLLFPVVTTNSHGTLATNQVSTMGLLWNPLPPPTTNDLHGVAWFGNQYYIAGGGGTILSSATGQNWRKLTTPTTAYLSCLEAYPGGLLAVGDQGTILTSSDGTNWTARASGTTNWLLRAHYLGGKFIAVGDNGTILTSSNAVNWSARTSGVSAFLNDVTLVTNTFFVVGNQGTVLQSTNAVSWQPLGIITGNSLYGTATQNGQLLVVGNSGSILRRQIVPVTTPINFLAYAHVTSADLFLVSGQVDQQFTLDSSTNLVNWTTGPLLDLFDSSGTLIFYLDNPTNPPPRLFYRNTLVPQ